MKKNPSESIGKLEKELLSNSKLPYKGTPKEGNRYQQRLFQPMQPNSTPTETERAPWDMNDLLKALPKQVHNSTHNAAQRSVPATNYDGDTDEPMDRDEDSEFRGGSVCRWC